MELTDEMSQQNTKIIRLRNCHEYRDKLQKMDLSNIPEDKLSDACDLFLKLVNICEGSTEKL